MQQAQLEPFPLWNAACTTCLLLQMGRRSCMSSVSSLQQRQDESSYPILIDEASSASCPCSPCSSYSW